MNKIESADFRRIRARKLAERIVDTMLTEEDFADIPRSKYLDEYTDQIATGNNFCLLCYLNENSYGNAVVSKLEDDVRNFNGRGCRS